MIQISFFHIEGAIIAYAESLQVAVAVEITPQLILCLISNRAYICIYVYNRAYIHTHTLGHTSLIQWKVHGL